MTLLDLANYWFSQYRYLHVRQQATAECSDRFLESHKKFADSYRKVTVYRKVDPLDAATARSLN